MSRVSVIVPAFQAEATLARTLRSVLGQTHRDIEVLVVDDGSADGTCAIAERFRSLDKRVKVIEQANAGVAAARNLAIEQADGDYIAPLDADDLWHPGKLELQLERFAQGGPRVGLVYNWFRTIGADDRVRVTSASPRVEGMCLHRHLVYNFIANGSTPLIRRSALGDLRYSPALALADCGGCEDYLLQLQLAREWEFALVPAWLTGYRKAGITMSSDIGRMIRSHIMVLGMMREGLDPSGQAVIRERLGRLHIEHVRNRLQRGKPVQAGAALVAALGKDPLRLPRSMAEEGMAALRQAAPIRRGDHFAQYPADRPDGRWRFKLASTMARLKQLDDACAGRTAA